MERSRSFPAHLSNQELGWVDAKGAAQVRAGGSGDIISLRLSPSVQYALVDRNDEQSGRPGAWILDLARVSCSDKGA